MKKWLVITIFSLCTSFVHAQTEDQLKLHVCHTLPEIYGWCSREKALKFIDLVLDVKPDVCVEIGTFGGSSLFPVAAALKYLNHGVIIGIDPWNKTENLKHFNLTEDPANTTWWSNVNFENIYFSYKNMLRKHGLESYAITLRMTSEKAVAQIDYIDILYIDGGHSEEAFINDVRQFLPKVRQGGYIWLNDSLWEQAQPAIELLLEECDVIKLIDNGNCILFKKWS